MFSAHCELTFDLAGWPPSLDGSPLVVLKLFLLPKFYLVIIHGSWASFSIQYAPTLITGAARSFLAVPRPSCGYFILASCGLKRSTGELRDMPYFPIDGSKKCRLRIACGNCETDSYRQHDTDWREICQHTEDS